MSNASAEVTKYRRRVARGSVKKVTKPVVEQPDDEKALDVETLREIAAAMNFGDAATASHAQLVNVVVGTPISDGVRSRHRSSPVSSSSSDTITSEEYMKDLVIVPREATQGYTPQIMIRLPEGVGVKKGVYQRMVSPTGQVVHVWVRANMLGGN